MYSDHFNVLQLAALLRAHGVRHAVLCPGSRNIPMVQTLSACPDFTCFSVTDERSAGFFALGLSLQVGAAVVVCCTSGSALLNLHPAVAEAFYRNIPLVVVSADRPEAWIGQMDGQTLPQQGVFGSLVKKSVHLPEPHTEENRLHANRLINEALLETTHHGRGPVHINLPLSEPLFHFTEKQLPDVRCIRRFDMMDGGWELTDFLHTELPRYKHRMLVVGQLSPDEASSLPALSTDWVRVTELLGNIPADSEAVRGFDMVLGKADEELRDALAPDLVVTIGGHIVSKRLKQLLRNREGLVHWHVGDDGAPVDLFCKLTTVIEASADVFLRLLNEVNSPVSSDYAVLWRSSIVSSWKQAKVPYSSLDVVRGIMEALPSGAVLHLANSSAVRLAERFPLSSGVEVHCNRGVNGIEGSVSAAVGYAALSDRLNFLLIGDLSFFYDMNGLWNEYVKSNLRIVVLNNGGGGIFHTLPGLEMNDKLHRFVTAEQHATARGWAEERGFDYMEVRDGSSLPVAVARLLDPASSVPVLLEVFTDAASDAEVVKDF